MEVTLFLTELILLEWRKQTLKYDSLRLVSFSARFEVLECLQYSLLTHFGKYRRGENRELCKAFIPLGNNENASTRSLSGMWGYYICGWGSFLNRKSENHEIERDILKLIVLQKRSLRNRSVSLHSPSEDYPYGIYFHSVILDRDKIK